MQIVRTEDIIIGKRFTILREQVRLALGKGFRRPMMKLVIADLRLQQRDSKLKVFPPLKPGV
jgi:hypothetical protein